MKNRKEKAKKAKKQNVIDMAFTFSAMSRVFKKGSNNKIRQKFNNFLEQFFDLNTKREFNNKHSKVCKWISTNIKTSKKSEYVSWGQAAKITDIVLKVYFYYCRLPSPKVASKIIPWLNAAIDTQLLNHLKNQYNSQVISQVSSLKDINKKTYNELQNIILSEIKKQYRDKIFPVQYDDIKWRELNR